ncbi:MAG TPA: polysaccharide deacetylase family protein [Steroidobacteraceae bacterium]|nr:polysaccharide deacetylase family protein [Steroidobacteraceae bacterium]
MNSLVKRIGRAKLRPLILERGRGHRKEIALTFDDGPHPEFTAAVLDVLKQHNAVATFFLVGNNAKRFPELVQRMLSDGHEIANHSMTHAEFARIPSSEIEREVTQMDAVLTQLGAPAGKIWFRPPKGVLNVRTLLYSAQRRRRYVLWSIDPKDFQASRPEEIVAAFKAAGPKGGDIVLLHDKSRPTVEALARLLEAIRSLSLTPVTVTQLAAK